MINYKRHSIALNPDEQKQYEEIKKRLGYGQKKIFMAMITALKPIDETQGDGKNKSAIVLNINEEE